MLAGTAPPARRVRSAPAAAPVAAAAVLCPRTSSGAVRARWGPGVSTTSLSSLCRPSRRHAATRPAASTATWCVAAVLPCTAAGLTASVQQLSLPLGCLLLLLLLLRARARCSRPPRCRCTPTCRRSACATHCPASARAPPAGLASIVCIPCLDTAPPSGRSTALSAADSRPPGAARRMAWTREHTAQVRGRAGAPAGERPPRRRWPGKDRPADRSTASAHASCLPGVSAAHAGECDDRIAACYCPSNTTYGRVPAPIEAPQGAPQGGGRPAGRAAAAGWAKLHAHTRVPPCTPCRAPSAGSPPRQQGRPMNWFCQPKGSFGGTIEWEDLFGPQGWCQAAQPKHKCECNVPGVPARPVMDAPGAGTRMRAWPHGIVATSEQRRRIIGRMTFLCSQHEHLRHRGWLSAAAPCPPLLPCGCRRLGRPALRPAGGAVLPEPVQRAGRVPGGLLQVPRRRGGRLWGCLQAPRRPAGSFEACRLPSVRAAQPGPTDPAAGPQPATRPPRHRTHAPVGRLARHRLRPRRRRGRRQRSRAGAAAPLDTAAHPHARRAAAGGQRHPQAAAHLRVRGRRWLGACGGLPAAEGRAPLRALSRLCTPRASACSAHPPSLPSLASLPPHLSTNRYAATSCPPTMPPWCCSTAMWAAHCPTACRGTSTPTTPPPSHVRPLGLAQHTNSRLLGPPAAARCCRAGAPVAGPAPVPWTADACIGASQRVLPAPRCWLP